MKKRFAALLCIALACAGCASYTFRSKVPEEARTIAVPVFENESGFPELDAVVTQYVLREFQHEGTFKIASWKDAAYRLDGRIVSSGTTSLSFDRNYASRAAEYRNTVSVRITLIERSTGKLIIDNQPLKASSTFLTRGDMLTGLRDSYPRIAKELSRRVVDTVLAQW